VIPEMIKGDKRQGEEDRRNEVEPAAKEGNRIVRRPSDDPESQITRGLYWNTSAVVYPALLSFHEMKLVLLPHIPTS
jgi:hypothetical protein